MSYTYGIIDRSGVAPFAGAWIETYWFPSSQAVNAVAPFAGAWIETYAQISGVTTVKSLPSRERGLKPRILLSRQPPVDVAPFAGAWIETADVYETIKANTVAPFAGAWIETSDTPGATSHPCVAPFAGAWIETWKNARENWPHSCRSLRGSVD